MSLMFLAAAATAAACLGRNETARGFSSSLPGFCGLSHDNAMDIGVLPKGHLPRFSPDFTSTLSSSWTSNLARRWSRLCRSLNAIKYSLDQRFHRASLHDLRYLARLRSSFSPPCHGSSSVNRLVLWNRLKVSTLVALHHLPCSLGVCGWFEFPHPE